MYHSLRAEWEKLGVVFLDMDSALREYPEEVPFAVASATATIAASAERHTA